MSECHRVRDAVSMVVLSLAQSRSAPVCCPAQDIGTLHIARNSSAVVEEA